MCIYFYAEFLFSMSISCMYNMTQKLPAVMHKLLAIVFAVGMHRNGGFLRAHAEIILHLMLCHICSLVTKMHIWPDFPENYCNSHIFLIGEG
jgi:hypothetical protein